MRPGIIFADLLSNADELKRVLGLRYWVTLSPRSLMLGRGRGIEAEPHIILLEDPHKAPVQVLWETYRAYILPCFNFQQPTIYQMRRIAP